MSTETTPALRIAQEIAAEIRRLVRGYLENEGIGTIEEMSDAYDSNELMIREEEQIAAIIAARIAEMVEDGEALDWLENHPGSVYASVDADGNKLDHFCAVPEKDQNARRGFTAPTPRQAIRAARAEQGGGKG